MSVALQVRMTRLAQIWQLREKQTRSRITQQQAELDEVLRQIALSRQTTDTIATDLVNRTAELQARVVQGDLAGLLAQNRNFHAELQRRLAASLSLADRQEQRGVAIQQGLRTQYLVIHRLQIKRQYLNKRLAK